MAAHDGDHDLIVDSHPVIQDDPVDEGYPVSELQLKKEEPVLDKTDYSHSNNARSHSLDFNPATEGHIHHLARAFSNMSAASDSRPAVFNPFDSPKDSRLDPSSPFFDAEEWAKSYMLIIHNDAERYPQRTTGISYRDINVYGFGSDTDYQKDVINIFFHATNSIKEMYRGRTRIPILTCFDGLVRPGEMCVVLGRPGR